MPHAISSGSQGISTVNCVLGHCPGMQNGCLGLFSIVSHRNSFLSLRRVEEGGEVKKDWGLFGISKPAGDGYEESS